MVKGTRVELNYQASHDPDIGAEIIRLTLPKVTCHRNYLYRKRFFSGGSHLPFAGEFNGHWSYYLLNVASTGATQLTEDAGDNTFDSFLFSDDKSFYYMKGDRTLLKVSLTTLVEREVCRVSDDRIGYSTQVTNSDCSKLVDIEITKNNWTSLDDWRTFHDFFHKGPHRRLPRVDLRGGESRVIHEEKIQLGHPTYRSSDDYIVVFCHEELHDLVGACIWLINEDDSHACKVKTYAPGKSCIHEFRVLDGSVSICVSYLKGWQERTTYRFDPESGANEAPTTMLACPHLMNSPDGTLLAGDGSGTPVDVKDTGGYPIDNDSYLCVLSMIQKRYSRAVRHDISWATVASSRQVTHLYPSFTPDSSAILLSSDKGGKPAIYTVKLPEHSPMLSA